MLGAELVVDATGRGSRTPVWLDTLGYERPKREQVKIELAYVSRTYRMRPDALGGDLAVAQAATPNHPRTGAGAAGTRRRPGPGDAGRHLG
ncbi:MAG TPA: hypothetical protein VFV41_08305 [Streptosporangiaceae bacterium]|nr:hypothetical protein [Streptosporangiaceae bacterium]